MIDYLRQDSADVLNIVGPSRIDELNVDSAARDVEHLLCPFQECVGAQGSDERQRSN